MSRRSTSWLAWSLWAMFAGMQVVIVWQVWQGPANIDSGFAVLLFGYATAGAVVASRRPDNAVGWLLLAVALTFAVPVVGEGYVLTRSPGYLGVAWVSGVVSGVWIPLVAVFLPLVFPDGRLLSRRWRGAAWLAAAAVTASVVGAAFRPGRLELEESIQNPLGASGVAADVVHVVVTAGDGLTTVAVVVALASLVERFRRSGGLQRRQLTWFALAVLLVFGGLVLAVAGNLIPQGRGDVVGAVGWFTFLFACVLAIPAATGIAILRHRLYDIDIVIKRTLVYGVLTATLLATYLVLVLLLQLALRPVTSESELAVAASTLAVAALFRPVRGRIQSVVDRRFFRQRYDAAQTLAGFAVHLRDELDLEALGVDLRRVVSETMQPAHVSLWLRGSR